MSGAASEAQPPRIAFLGLGWIGRMRLEALAKSGAGIVAALCDADASRLAETAQKHSTAETFSDLDALLKEAGDRLDALVIATPNALHCRQGLAALEHGLSLYVQKPLGIEAAEVDRLLDAAQTADRLVEVDYTYRGLSGAARLRESVESGELGEIFYAEGVFHNAYGPDKAWCFDPALAGGGAFLDLGVHLVDLILHSLDCPEAEIADITAWRRDLADHPGIDGFTALNFHLARGPRCRIMTSWHAHTGKDCDFRLTLFGSEGTGEIRNTGGSFFDFEFLRKTGRNEEILAADHREWMDRGIIAWSRRLAEMKSYNASAEINRRIAKIVDAVYDR
ncbi:MAG: Gfo/Idh/MocA family oxidoreductase [Planctomycetes bacterium]|nr:Gfo/Idh/MocA family oxidoreductase [Planctomycetota bacterium]